MAKWRHVYNSPMVNRGWFLGKYDRTASMGSKYALVLCTEPILYSQRTSRLFCGTIYVYCIIAVQTCPLTWSQIFLLCTLHTRVMQTVRTGSSENCHTLMNELWILISFTFAVKKSNKFFWNVLYGRENFTFSFLYTSNSDCISFLWFTSDISGYSSGNGKWFIHAAFEWEAPTYSYVNNFVSLISTPIKI